MAIKHELAVGYKPLDLTGPGQRDELHLWGLETWNCAQFCKLKTMILPIAVLLMV
jgi:hypothetical protein